LGPASVRRAALPHGPLLLTVSRWLAEHLPERVVVVGRPTLSRAVATLLRTPGVVVECVADGPWADPGHVVSAVHPFAALEADTAPSPASPWAGQWRAAGQRLAGAIRAEGFAWPTGLSVAAVLAGAVASDAVLVVGSSNPVRDLDLAAEGAVAGRVVANRGLAGIDGLLSTAVGVALASPAPAYALLGDLTFLHDSGGLLIGPDEPHPDLTVVVVNDDGGGIFTTLEHGAPERSATFERIFGTPTGTDLEALCRAHGVSHVRAASPAHLGSLVAERPRGLRVVEVVVDRSTHRQAHEHLRALAARTLDD
ncbi:MAG: thiamine pyrophosphate-dependent enzyme, partial [Ornithinibacter sp.]